MPRRTIVVCCLLVSLFPGLAATGSPGRAEQKRPVPVDVAWAPDLVYRTVGGQPLMLDLAWPRAGKGPFATVVVIHGTGLLTRGRKAAGPLVLDLARAGFTAAAVGYRFSPTDPYPAAIDDLEQAVRWLRRNSGKYPVDGARLGAVGFSGGGSLACLLGMDPAREAKTGVPCRVQAVVSYFAPTDLARLHARSLEWLRSDSFWDKLRGLYVRTALEQWLGGDPAQVPGRYAQASPITHAGKETAPTLLIHGTADGVVPVEQAQELARRLRQAGGPVRLLLLPGAPHDFDELGDAHARRAAAEMLHFLQQHLARPTVPRSGRSK